MKQFYLAQDQREAVHVYRTVANRSQAVWSLFPTLIPKQRKRKIDERFSKLRELICSDKDWRRRIKFILPLPPENNSGENEPLHIKLMCGMFAKLCVWNKSDVQPFLTLNLRLVINGHILIFSNCSVDRINHDVYHCFTNATEHDLASVSNLVYVNNILVTLCVDLPDYAEDSIYVQNKNLLESARFYDTEIECNDGEIIRCHKALLSANSDVLAAELGSNFQEGISGKIKMQYSKDAVSALLKYQYYRSIDTGNDSGFIAFELLQIADFYAIGNLRIDIEELLIESANDWFDEESLFEIYSFLIQIPQTCNTAELFCKLHRVFKSKQQEIIESNTFVRFLNNKAFREAWFKHSLAF